MILRLITSLNWVVGVLGLAVAVAFPFYWEVTIDAAKAEAARTAQEIARAEQVHAEHDRGRLVYYGVRQAEALQRELQLSRPITNGNFTFETYADGNNVLVIRVITSEAALTSGRLPPLMYTIKARTTNDLPRENEALEGDWLRLSGKKIGLLALLAG